jgi:hypothetical protein
VQAKKLDFFFLIVCRSWLSEGIQILLEVYCGHVSYLASKELRLGKAPPSNTVSWERKEEDEKERKRRRSNSREATAEATVEARATAAVIGRRIK